MNIFYPQWKTKDDTVERQQRLELHWKQSTVQNFTEQRMGMYFEEINGPENASV